MRFKLLLFVTLLLALVSSASAQVREKTDLQGYSATLLANTTFPENMPYGANHLDGRAEFLVRAATGSVTFEYDVNAPRAQDDKKTGKPSYKFWYDLGDGQKCYDAEYVGNNKWRVERRLSSLKVGIWHFTCGLDNLTIGRTRRVVEPLGIPLFSFDAHNVKENERGTLKVVVLDYRGPDNADVLSKFLEYRMVDFVSTGRINWSDLLDGQRLATIFNPQTNQAATQTQQPEPKQEEPVSSGQAQAFCEAWTEPQNKAMVVKNTGKNRIQVKMTRGGSLPRDVFIEPGHWTSIDLSDFSDPAAVVLQVVDCQTGEKRDVTYDNANAVGNFA